jgi:nascent polypeptide-associated complex subunit alpha
MASEECKVTEVAHHVVNSHAAGHDDNVNHSNDESHDNYQDIVAKEVSPGSGNSVRPRNEKKAQKIIEKLGLKKVDGDTRVTLQRAQNASFVIQEPQVYRNPSTGTYIIFGAAKVDSESVDLAQKLAGLRVDGGGAADTGADTVDTFDSKDDPGISAQHEEADDDIDTTGITEEDIRVVQQQAVVSQAVAVAALRENDLDVVNTIMELTA